MESKVPDTDGEEQDNDGEVILEDEMGSYKGCSLQLQGEEFQKEKRTNYQIQQNMITKGCIGCQSTKTNVLMIRFRSCFRNTNKVAWII